MNIVSASGKQTSGDLRHFGIAAVTGYATGLAIAAKTLQMINPAKKLAIPGAAVVSDDRAIGETRVQK